MNDNKKKIANISYWINEKGKIIALFICLGILFFLTSDSIRDYIKYRGKVMEVEATVVDSLNYTSQVSDDCYYKSRVIVNWEVDNIVYEGEFVKSGTLLIGDKINVSVLKDDPGIVKVASLSNVLAPIVISLLLIFTIFIIIKHNEIYKKFYSKFILKEKRKSDDKDLYIDIAEVEKENRDRKRRITIFYLTISIVSTIAFSWTLNSEYQEYRAVRDRQDIQVKCLVLETDIYDKGGYKFSNIIAQWEIDGQIYKRAIDELLGSYEKGEEYYLTVKSDTKESVKLHERPERNTFIMSLIAVLASILFLVRNIYVLVRRCL